MQTPSILHTKPPHFAHTIYAFCIPHKTSSDCSRKQPQKLIFVIYIYIYSVPCEVQVKIQINVAVYTTLCSVKISLHVLAKMIRRHQA